MNTLSTVQVTWNLPLDRLDYSLWTLANQTEPPLEMVVVNASSDEFMFQQGCDICGKYTRVKMIAARTGNFNLSRLQNIGIQHTSGEYVMVATQDKLFSPRFIGEVCKLMGPNYQVVADSHSLPIGLDLGPTDKLFDRWEWLLAQRIPKATFAVGTILCVEREWLFKVRGYDEVRSPFNYNDSDLIMRGGKDGWDDNRVVDANIAQVLHIGHGSTLGRGFGGDPPDMNLPVVRNPDGWGEL